MTPVRSSHPAALALGLVCAVAVTAPPAAAQKAPALIREHILGQIVVSSEPFHAESLDPVVESTVWRVSIDRYGGGQSSLFMAVDEGEVLRLHSHAAPESRESFLRLLPEDFRVASVADARLMVAAAVALHGDFSEPEVPPADMRVEQREGEYLFVDGERFGEATGYRIAHDAQNRVTGFEYSWELDAEPL